MNTDEKYNKLISTLKSSQPVLDNPEGLTEKIMSSLKPERTHTIQKVILLARPWLSAAAVLLIGLFIFQQSPTPSEKQAYTETPEWKTELQLNNCFTSYFLNHPGKNFFDSYLCYLKETEQRNRSSEQFLMKIQNNL